MATMTATKKINTSKAIKPTPDKYNLESAIATAMANRGRWVYLSNVPVANVTAAHWGLKTRKSLKGKIFDAVVQDSKLYLRVS